MTTRKTIVIDATPILGSSGHRGIGRMAYDLLHGLEAIRDEWRDDLDLRVVTDLSWTGGTVDREPGAAAEKVYATRGREGKLLVHRRRLLLDSVVEREGAHLLHMVEALGVPLTRRVPRVVTCHDLIPLRLPDEYLGYGAKRIVQRPADTFRYRSAERVVAISRRTADDVRTLLHVDPAKIDVVPNGIDLAQWTSTVPSTDAERLRALGLGDRPFVVYVGWRDRRKDLPTMVRAVTEAGVDLLWVGQLNARDHRLIRWQMFKERVSLDRVRFAGFVSTPDLAVLYRHALAHLFLSRLEGFGISVAEAMASGCPVILAQDSGTDEVGGDAVFAVPQGDAGAAAAAMRRLLSDPSERTRRHDIGIARAHEFSRDAMARGYLGAWRRALHLP